MPFILLISYFMSYISNFFSCSSPPPPAAQHAKASPIPSKPPTTSSMKVSTSNVSHLSKTEPEVSVFRAASSVSSLPPQPKSASSTNPKTSFTSETPQQTPGVIQDCSADGVSSVTVKTSAPPTTSTTLASSGSEATTAECQTLVNTRETKVETVTEANELTSTPALPLSANLVEKNAEKSPDTAATVEPLIETTTEPSVEASLPAIEALETRASVVQGPTESMVEVTEYTAAKKVQTKGTDSGGVETLYATTIEPSIETTIELSADTSITRQETLESIAAVSEGAVEPTTEVEADREEVIHVSFGANKEPLRETTITSVVEASLLPVEAVEAEVSVEGPVEPTVDAPAEKVLAKSIDSGEVSISVDPSVEASIPLVEALEIRASVAEASTMEAKADTTAQAVQTNSTDSGVVNVSQTATVEPLLESTVEPTIETEGADNLSHAALIQNTPESAVLPLKSEVESKVESSLGKITVEKDVNESEQMTLESVTLHPAKDFLEALKTDDLLKTKFILDEKAEKQLQELLVQTGMGAEHKASPEAENSSEDESEILTKVLSKWESLSEDLQELEEETGTLVKELLCHVPAVLSKSPSTIKASSASDQLVRANGESLQMQEKANEEDMTLESVTLAEVKAQFGSLETEVLQETSDALEKEADVLAKEEKIEVETAIEDAVFEDTTEAKILTLDSISEAIDAIEAETSVILEAILGSEQGLRQPPDTLPLKLVPQSEMICQEAEKESGKQDENVLEAMSLEAVTLAEVEASLGTLENKPLSETTAYLENEAEILAGERRMEVEEGTVSEETIEALDVESLSLPEADGLSEDLQTDALMEELLFTIPGHVAGVREAQISQEGVGTSNLDGKFNSCYWWGDIRRSKAH